MLARLVYTSTRTPICTEEEIDKILTSANKNNREKEITGILLYDQKQFIQCLEGPSVTITQLYDKLKTDPRHKNVFMVAFGPAQDRLFPDWAMGRKDTGSKIVEYHKEMDTVDRNTVEAILSGHEVAIDQATRMLQRFVAA